METRYGNDMKGACRFVKALGFFRKKCPFSKKHGGKQGSVFFSVNFQKRFRQIPAKLPQAFLPPADYIRRFCVYNGSFLYLPVYFPGSIIVSCIELPYVGSLRIQGKAAGNMHTAPYGGQAVL